MTPPFCRACHESTAGDCGGHFAAPNTNYNQAIQRGDARFLILTSDQAAYIERLIRNQLQVAHDQGWNEMIALGESVLEQLEKR